MRAWLAFIVASGHTYSACATPLSASKAGAISSARRISDLTTLEAERTGRCLSLTHLQHSGGIFHIANDRQPADIRENLAQNLESLADEVGGLNGQAGDIAARLCQRGDHAAPDWVPGTREHDGDGCGCLLCGRDRASHRNNDIDLEPDKFGRDLGIALGTSLGPTIVYDNGAAFNPPQFA